MVNYRDPKEIVLDALDKELKRLEAKLSRIEFSSEDAQLVTELRQKSLGALLADKMDDALRFEKEADKLDRKLIRCCTKKHMNDSVTVKLEIMGCKEAISRIKLGYL